MWLRDMEGSGGDNGVGGGEEETLLFGTATCKRFVRGPAVLRARRADLPALDEVDGRCAMATPADDCSGCVLAHLCARDPGYQSAVRAPLFIIFVFFFFFFLLLLLLAAVATFSWCGSVAVTAVAAAAGNLGE